MQLNTFIMIEGLWHDEVDVTVMTVIFCYIITPFQYLPAVYNSV